MMLDCHMHTPLCGHAVGLPVEYVRAAAERGLRLITFTCHIPMAAERFGGRAIRMEAGQMPEYLGMVAEARHVGEGLGVEVLCGIEAEVFPDPEIMAAMDTVLETVPFDFVLGSLHHPLPRYRSWLVEHGVARDADKIEVYFMHLQEAARSGRYHSMAHPDVIRIYGTVQAFDPRAHEAVIRSFLRAVKEQDISIEVNTSGLSKGAYELHPDPVILDWASELGVALTLGSDAHRPESVARHFEQVLPLLRGKGFREVRCYRGGKAAMVPLPG
jgi:histidinol-phosphatase (PHP family)